MKFDCENLMHGVPKVKFLEENILPNGYFRISLSDFLPIWQGFPLKGFIQKRDRLESVFNTNYFDDYIVISDSISIEKIKSTNFSQPSPKDGSGFIYIYTFEDNVLAGARKEGFLWWERTRFEPKLKIGRTEQHPFYRIEQQLNQKVNIPEPPILMAILWTELVAPCERDIHNDFTKQGKRLVDNKGRHARGGIEWFKDELTQSLPAIYQWVIHYRNPVSSKELVLSVPGFYSDLGDPSLHFSISRPVKNPRGQEQFSSLSRREKSQKKDNKNKSKPLTISCIRIDKYGGENIEFGCLECSVKVYIQKICAVKFRTSKVVVRLTNGQRHSFCVRSKGQVDSVLSFVQEAKWRLIEKEGIKTYIAPTVGQQIKQRAVF